MAHKNRPNAALSNQMTLPPIRRICSIAQDPISLNSEDGNSPLRFLKLPRLERRPIVKSKTPLSLQETGQKNESYKSYVAIDKNFHHYDKPLQSKELALLKDGRVLRTQEDRKKYTFTLAYTELKVYAANVIYQRTRLLKINPLLPRCSNDLCSYFADG